MDPVVENGVLRICACRCAEFLRDFSYVSEPSMRSVSKQVDELLRIFATLLKGSYSTTPIEQIPGFLPAILDLGDALTFLRTACGAFGVAQAEPQDASARAMAGILDTVINLDQVTIDLETCSLQLRQLLGICEDNGSNYRTEDDETQRRNHYLVTFRAHAKSITDAARIGKDIVDMMASTDHSLQEPASSADMDEAESGAEATRTAQSRNVQDDDNLSTMQELLSQALAEPLAEFRTQTGVLLARLQDEVNAGKADLATADADKAQRYDAWEAMTAGYESQLARLQAEKEAVQADLATAKSEIVCYQIQHAIFHKDLKSLRSETHRIQPCACGDREQAIDGEPFPAVADDAMDKNKDNHAVLAEEEPAQCDQGMTIKLDSMRTKLEEMRVKLQRMSEGQKEAKMTAILRAAVSEYDPSLTWGSVDTGTSGERVTAIFVSLSSNTMKEAERELLRIASQSENETNGHSLRLVAQGLFEAACRDSGKAGLHAHLFKSLYNGLHQTICDGTTTDASGGLITRGKLFTECVMNRAQEEFELGERSQLPLDSQFGLPRFIGELFKNGTLPEKIVHECMRELLREDKEQIDFEIGRVFQLLRTVGGVLDSRKEGHAMMNTYFERLGSLRSWHPRRRGFIVVRYLFKMRLVQWNLAVSETKASNLLHLVTKDMAERIG